MKNRIKEKLWETSSSIGEIVFPSRCLICGELLLFHHERGIDLCHPCFSSLTLLTGKRCIICSLPLISEETTCLRCRERSYHFYKHLSLFLYRGAVKELIYYYKFKQKYSLARLFSRLVHHVITETYPHLPVIPVPTRKGRMFTTKENHLKPIMNRLKKNYNNKILDCLIRKGDIPQKKLSFNERLENLRGKILLKKGILSGVKEVILFDDIFTTGATADECSRVLRNSGVSNVYSLSLAID